MQKKNFSSRKLWFQSCKFVYRGTEAIKQIGITDVNASDTLSLTQSVRHVKWWDPNMLEKCCKISSSTSHSSYLEKKKKLITSAHDDNSSYPLEFCSFHHSLCPEQELYDIFIAAHTGGWWRIMVSYKVWDGSSGSGTFKQRNDKKVNSLGP